MHDTSAGLEHVSNPIIDQKSFNTTAAGNRLGKINLNTKGSDFKRLHRLLAPPLLDLCAQLRAAIVTIMEDVSYVEE